MEITLVKIFDACKEIGLSDEMALLLVSKLGKADTAQPTSNVISMPDYSGSLTREELAAATKNIPMKVANNYTWGNHDHRPDGDCPACGRNLSGNASSPKYKRCPDCGQKLDWH